MSAADELEIIARMLTYGNHTRAEIILAGEKLGAIAPCVRKMQRTLDEITADAQEDEQRRPSQHDIRIEGEPADPFALTGAVQTLVNIFLASVNEQPKDNELFAELTAGWIMAEVLSHTSDPARAMRHLMAHISPLLVKHGLVERIGSPGNPVRMH